MPGPRNRHSRGGTPRAPATFAYYLRVAALTTLVRPDVDDVYFVARPLAGRSFRSESFVFPRGTTAVWSIGNQSATSYVALR